MKKILASLFFLLAGLAPALAQVPYLSASQIAPHWGFVRKAPCGTGAGDSCGSNPTTWHITPDQCGMLFSTGGARNADGSTFSTKGNRYTLPTVAEFTATGMGTGAGAAGSSGFTNREAQCEIHFVMGAPGPSNYLRVGIDGVQGVDKVTPFGQGAYDLFYGDLVFDYVTPGVVTFIWNSSSWLIRSGSPEIMAKMQMGQTASHGNGRLFQVTTQPSWWSVDSIVGKLAYCPNNGRGTAGASNGGFQLTLLPVNCIFRDNVSTTATDWIVMRNHPSGVATGIAAGAAYIAGTAPNGTAYAAGNYPVLTVTASTAFVSGDTIEVHNLPTTLGTVLEGRYIGKLIDATHIELHEWIDEGNGIEAATNVGPPASFIAGDSIRAGVTNPVAFNYTSLTTEGIATTRITNPVNGVDMGAGSTHNTIVGVARRITGSGYLDTSTNRLVASYFNPKLKECRGVYSTDRTFTGTSMAEVNSEARCNFIYITGVSAQAGSLGDQGQGVDYVIQIQASNNTAAGGCKFGVSFNGGAVEPQTAEFVNPAGVSGGKQMLTIAGVKRGLSETASTGHYITIFGQETGAAGTCTVYSANTSNSSFHWQ